MKGVMQLARPTKQGLDYFPLDVGFFEDVKIRRLKKDCGNQAISILIAIFCIIYRDEGYYVEINSDVLFLIADMFGVSEDTVEKIVEKAIQVGIFDSNKFHNYKILTSKGIQERYFSAASRKTQVLVHRDFVLKNVSAYNNWVYVDNNSVSVCNNPQSKVKESKVNKSKEKNIGPNGPRSYSENNNFRLEEEKKNKKSKKFEKEIKHRYGPNSNVLLTDEEFEKLKKSFPADYEKRIEDISYYLASTGKTYKSHYMTILNWARMDKARGKGQFKKTRNNSDSFMKRNEDNKSTDEWLKQQLKRSRGQSLRGDSA